MNMPPVARRSFPHAQRGAASVAIVILFLSILAAALATALSMSGSVVRDAAMSEAQTGALFLADSGVERAAYNYSTSGACTALGVGAGATAYAPPGSAGTFTIDSAATTDFTGAALSSKRCRIQTRGYAFGNATRVVQAIVDRSGNTLPPSANSDFNAPPGVCVSPGCQPAGWTLNNVGGQVPPGAWDDFGGPDGSRAATTKKEFSGSSTSTAAGQFGFSPAISVTGPITMTITFDYKHETGGGGGNTMELYFTLLQQGPGTLTWTSNTFQAGTALGYRSGSVTIPIAQAGALIIDRLSFSLLAKSGLPRQIWLDNIVLQGPGGAGVTRVIAWRETVSP